MRRDNTVWFDWSLKSEACGDSWLLRLASMSAVVSVRPFAIALVAMLVACAAIAQPLTKVAAIALAEKFIAENGYTKLPTSKLKSALDPESLEWGFSRDKTLAHRFNTLNGRAIGIKSGGKGEADGWSVAFDFAGGRVSSTSCRVVTMEKDGSNLRVQHVDGIRTYFAGFD